MHTKSFALAALLVALLGLGSGAYGQFGPSAPYGVAYPGMGMDMGFGPMGPGPMGGPMGPMGPGAFAPAMYAPPPPMQAPMQGPPMIDGKGAGYLGPDCGWCHRVNIFGEFLYLRARNAEVAYAVPIDGNLIVGPTSDQVQVGPVQIVDPDYQPGFRFGAGFTLSECSAVVFTWTQLDASTSDSISLPGEGPVLRSLVSHPNPLNVGADGLDAFANQFTQFKLLDWDYKGLLACSDAYEISYVLGVRYAKLRQNFDALFTVLGEEQVASEIDFEGGGLRLGLEGIRYGLNNQLFGYARGATSLVGGEFRADYLMGTQADPVITDTSWRAGRLVTILDFEVGLGWRNHCDNLRLSVGYMYSCWHNVLKTNEWIDAVQQNNFVQMSDRYHGMITFDGLTARVEVLW